MRKRRGPRVVRDRAPADAIGDTWRAVVRFYRELRAAGLPPRAALAGARALAASCRPVLPADVRAVVAELTPGRAGPRGSDAPRAAGR